MIQSEKYNFCSSSPSEGNVRYIYEGFSGFSWESNIRAEIVETDDPGIRSSDPGEEQSGGGDPPLCR